MSQNDEAMSVDGDENSNASSSSDDDGQEQILIAKAEELEGKLSSNKFLYDAHIEIVDLYRKLGDLNSLREAYKRFHECFPMTPKLWLTWLRDEIQIASTPEDQKQIFKLFDKAVEDYLSVEIWIEYAQFSIGVSDLQTTRSIIERGLTAGGLHVTEGSLLWDTLREVENAHIALHPVDSDEWKAQISRLAEVFKRQLSVPLFGMENTYNEYQEWVSTLPDGLVDVQAVEWSYKRALSLLKTYKPLEERILSADSTELRDIYKEYVKLAQKDPSTVICLYERALVDLCLSPEVWSEYCAFLFNLDGAAVKVSARALRNCPWSEELWIERLRILEKHNIEHTEVLNVFEQGLNSILPNPGLDLWLSYLEYTHRNQDSTKVDKSFLQAIKQLGIDKDPSSKVSRWYARLLAKRADMVTARKIWNDIMSHQQNKSSSVLWLEYFNLERQYGEPQQLRALFKRAVSTNTDWPQCIAEEWLMFERETGNLEDVMKCLNKTTSVLKNFSQMQHVSENRFSDPKRQVGAKVDQREKRRYDDEERDEKFKKGRYENNRRSKREEFQPPPVRKHIEKNPKTTVFVSNLHHTVDEAMLKEIFPNASLLEIVKDRKGKSRCYGYVQFLKEEEAMTALARDRVPIDGRPVFISELKQEKGERKPAFKYATTTENNKLFVKGLPPDKTKEDVEQLFKEFKPKDVRLVVKKSGHGKGIAYVEFEDEQSAQKALKGTDQLKLDDDHTISVAVSAPPPKNMVNLPTTNDPIRHARSRLQVPMIPRSIQVKNVDNKQSKSGEEGSAQPPKKTNADFRNMLLKK